MVDYHIHTLLSDGRSTHDECLAFATDSGLQEIGFSDHVCLKFPDWSTKKAHFEKMKNILLEIRQRDDLPFSVKFGIEADYFPGQEPAIQKLISLFPVDYVIGSIHYLQDWNFDTNPKDYQQLDIDRFYQDYFRVLQQCAHSKLFDFLGHIDIPKKFGYYPSFDLKPFYEATAKVFAQNNTVYELNTSGLDRPCKAFYPSEEFVRICFEHNIPVTLGSDAHHAHAIGKYFSRAVDLLKSTGYREIAVFTQRKRNYIPI
ncbi:MAG: histidinol-phosphatase HisJ family protein [Bacteroidales bacterium]|jgi:histidinol-phosphatase (PHP family)|nr:histidinol-phosphatase HisJ family protein [Bacteroidales bacterium]